MPDESGIKALKELQNNETTKSTPIIMVTGVSTDIKRFIGSTKQVHPPEAFFEKPIDRDELLKKVKELLNL